MKNDLPCVKNFTDYKALIQVSDELTDKNWIAGVVLGIIGGIILSAGIIICAVPRYRKKCLAKICKKKQQNKGIYPQSEANSLNKTNLNPEANSQNETNLNLEANLNPEANLNLEANINEKQHKQFINDFDEINQKDLPSTTRIQNPSSQKQQQNSQQSDQNVPQQKNHQNNVAYDQPQQIQNISYPLQYPQVDPRAQHIQYPPTFQQPENQPLQQTQYPPNYPQAQYQPSQQFQQPIVINYQGNNMPYAQIQQNGPQILEVVIKQEDYKT